MITSEFLMEYGNLSFISWINNILACQVVQ